MAYVKAIPPSVVYHLTRMENLDSVLDDGKIRRFMDSECWFCESLGKMKAYMEQTVMCEGKPYYAVSGQLCRYPKFVPEDYVLLKLTPCGYEDNWYRWNQEIPPGSPKELVQAAKEFSGLKIGYRGDLTFRNAEVIDVEVVPMPICCAADAANSATPQKIPPRSSTFLFCQKPGSAAGFVLPILRSTAIRPSSQ